MNKWYMPNPTATLENTTQTFQGFTNTNGSPNIGQTIRSSNNQQRKRELAQLWT